MCDIDTTDVKALRELADQIVKTVDETCFSDSRESVVAYVYCRLRELIATRTEKPAEGRGDGDA